MLVPARTCATIANADASARPISPADPAASDPLGGAHPLPAGRLDVDDLEGAVTGADEQCRVGGNDFAGHARPARCVRRAGAEDLHLAVAETGPCTGPRIEGAHLPSDPGCWLLPADSRHFPGDLRRIGRIVVVLVPYDGGIHIHQCESLDEREGTELCEPHGELATGFVRRDRCGHLMDDGTRVHAGDHLHDRDARILVTLEDRVLDGSGAPEPRQQRGMHVHHPSCRGVEQRLLEDVSVGDYDPELRLEPPDLVEHRRIVGVWWL